MTVAKKRYSATPVTLRDLLQSLIERDTDEDLLMQIAELPRRGLRAFCCDGGDGLRDGNADAHRPDDHSQRVRQLGNQGAAHTPVAPPEIRARDDDPNERDRQEPGTADQSGQEFAAQPCDDERERQRRPPGDVVTASPALKAEHARREINGAAAARRFLAGNQHGAQSARARKGLRGTGQPFADAPVMLHAAGQKQRADAECGQQKATGAHQEQRRGSRELHHWAFASVAIQAASRPKYASRDRKVGRAGLAL